MKGAPTSAGSASRRENEFQAGGGHAKESGETSSSFLAASREILFHSRDGSREDAKTRRKPGPMACRSAKTSLVK